MTIRTFFSTIFLLLLSLSSIGQNKSDFPKIKVTGIIIVDADTKGEAIEQADKELAEVLHHWDINGVN
jgi:hypothetical protein